MLTGHQVKAVIAIVRDRLANQAQQPLVRLGKR